MSTATQQSKSRQSLIPHQPQRSQTAIDAQQDTQDAVSEQNTTDTSQTANISVQPTKTVGTSAQSAKTIGTNTQPASDGTRNVNQKVSSSSDAHIGLVDTRMAVADTQDVELSEAVREWHEPSSFRRTLLQQCKDNPFQTLISVMLTFFATLIVALFVSFSTSVDARFASVDARFASVDARFTEVNNEIKDLRQDMNDGFAEINVKLASIITALNLTEVVFAAEEGRIIK